MDQQLNSSDELVSRNAAVVGPYKNKSLNKCDNAIIYLLLHFPCQSNKAFMYFAYEYIHKHYLSGF